MTLRPARKSPREEKNLTLSRAVTVLNGVTVTRNVSIEVECGKVVGLLGSNGAGKTTLIRGILGLVPLQSGYVRFNGKTFAELAEPLRTVGVILGNSMLDPRLSAQANLRVYASAYGIESGKIKQVLRLVGLAEVHDKPVRYYSLGMKKRLSIAVSLLLDPTYLVLDEPANGLDPAGLRWLIKFLDNLAHQQGKGILVSSHMLADFEAIIDKVIILEEGAILYEGYLENLRGTGITRVLVEDESGFASALNNEGIEARVLSPGVLEIDGDVRDKVGCVALSRSFPLRGLELQQESLMSAYLRVLEAQDRQKYFPKRRKRK